MVRGEEEGRLGKVGFKPSTGYSPRGRERKGVQLPPQPLHWQQPSLLSFSPLLSVFLSLLMFSVLFSLLVTVYHTHYYQCVTCFLPLFLLTSCSLISCSLFLNLSLSLLITIILPPIFIIRVFPSFLQFNYSSLLYSLLLLSLSLLSLVSPNHFKSMKMIHLLQQAFHVLHIKYLK